jgi:hypothetical protein
MMGHFSLNPFSQPIPKPSCHIEGRKEKILVLSDDSISDGDLGEFRKGVDPDPDGYFQDIEIQ